MNKTLARLRARRAALTGPWPRCVQLELLNICNLRCPLCQINRLRDARPTFFPLEGVRRLVEGIEGVPELFTLYGRIGEPLLHPDIVAIVHCVHTISDTRSRISTNGMRLTGRLMEELVESPLTELIVALDGATPESYAQYRRGGDFHALCRNIEQVVARRDQVGRQRPKITTQLIPMKHNEHEIDGFIKLSKDMGCDGVRVKVSGSVGRSRTFRPRSDDLLAGRALSVEGGNCHLRKIYVDCGGQVFPCCYGAACAEESGPGPWLLGNVLERGLPEIRRGAAGRRLEAVLRRGPLPSLCIDKCIENLNRQYYRANFRQPP